MEHNTSFECSVQHLHNCSFSSWYENFKPVTFKSTIIPLPHEFIDYLQEDGIVMDDKSFPVKPEKYDRYDEGETQWSDEEKEVEQKQFPELEKEIARAIDELEGAVFPKLNWSSPKDATWMATSGNLKCNSSYEIFLLLKSSEFINHDISLLLKHFPDKATLILRKWFDLKPSMEFRCFVKSQKLIGITQRDCTNYYPFLKEMKEELQTKISSFYEKQIHEKFPETNYAFDVYVSTKRVVLVDFNPWTSTTETFLFSWDELQNWEEGIEFRIVTSQANISPGLALKSAVPFDLVEFSQGSAISELIQKMKEQGIQTKDE